MVKAPSTPIVRTLARAAAALALAMLAFAPDAVHAHHPMGGMMPTSAWHGFLSGLGHPIIGLDHLAYLAGITILAVAFGRPFAVPAGFVAALIGGVLLHVAGVALPHAESLVTLSVVLVGLMVALAARRLTMPVFAGLAGAGVLHGFALGETVVGAEPTPILSYLLGLVDIQIAVAGLLAHVLTRPVPGALMARPAMLRLTGVAICAAALAAMAGSAIGS